LEYLRRLLDRQAGEEAQLGDFGRGRVLPAQAGDGFIDWDWLSSLPALEDTGFVIEALREPRVPDDAIKSERGRRWQRLPLFLHLRARRL